MKLLLPMRRRLVPIAVAALAAFALSGAKLATPDRAASRPTQVRIEVAKPATKQHATTPVRIAATGDIAMVEGPGGSYFSRVRRYLRGSVVLGNLEGTLTSRGSSKCGSGSSNCFAFRAPTSYASLLRDAGFTVLNLANNHAYDYGSVGQEDTVQALDRLGLAHTGRPGEIAVVRVGSTRVALVGFASYSWAQSLTDIPAAQRLVRRAVERADVVIATFHGGAEGSDQTRVSPSTEYFLGENRGDLMAFSHAVIDAGADLVVGHGPHVLRGMEWYRGRLIAYSMGNFLGYRTLSTSGVLALSGVLQVTLRADGRFVRGNLVPLHLVDGGIPAHDPAEAAHGHVRELSRRDFGRRGVGISYTGVLKPPA